MRLFLIRHGNTFAPGEPVLRVGRHEDLPLVEKGLEQAHANAAALRRMGASPACVYASSLQRARVCGEIILEGLGLNGEPSVDDRMMEIDYGAWGGLTDAEITSRFGPEQLAAWNDNGVWPPEGVWGESEAEVRGRVRSFINDLIGRHAPDADIVIVSSNGVLRFALDLVPGCALDEAARKMKTGNMGLVVWDGNAFAVEFWNRKPDDL
jgi:probable phosphoglycerate mutase